MKKLSCVIQKTAEETFWLNLIVTALYDGAKKYDIVLEKLCEDEAFPRMNGDLVFVIGTEGSWINIICDSLYDSGAEPIVVNACLPIDIKHKVNAVVFEIDEAMVKILSYLASYGKKNIALLGLHRSSAADILKNQVFENYIKEHGINGTAIFSNSSIEICIREFLQSSNGFDAILCSNDTVALTLMREKEIRRRCKNGELYIIGMGNLYIGNYGDLSLSTIALDYSALGNQAIKLARFIESDELMRHTIISLPCKFFSRKSTQCRPIKAHDDSTTMTEQSEKNLDDYFDGNISKNIITLECILQKNDTVDRDIIYSLSKGLSCSSIAEKVCLTERAVRYRIKKICKLLNLESTKELRILLYLVFKTDSSEFLEKGDNNG